MFIPAFLTCCDLCIYRFALLRFLHGVLTWISVYSEFSTFMLLCFLCFTVSE